MRFSCTGAPGGICRCKTCFRYISISKMRYLIISFAIDLLECGLYGQKYSVGLGAIGEGEYKRGLVGYKAGEESLWKVDRWTEDRATDCGEWVIGEAYHTIG